MLLRFAFRNIRAYRKRTLITVFLTTLTTALFVFATAWMDGSHQAMIRNAVEIYPGYIQITGSAFRDTPSYDHLIFDVDKVNHVLAQNTDISTFAARFEAYVLFSAGDKAVGGMLTGIEPEREKRLSRLFSSKVQGAYLNDEDTNLVYMGSELARRLRVQVGDELAFVGSGADYSFAADKLRVKGIFQTGLYDFDANAAFMAKNYFDRIMASTNYATHIIVLPRQPEQADRPAAALGRVLGPDYQVADWHQTMAALVKAMQLDSLFGYITLGILFIVIFFVIMIYTLLSVFARIREIGILRAIGTTPGEILVLLLLESSVLAGVSVVLGGLIGGAFAFYFHIHPLVFSGFEEQFKQYGLAVSAIPTAFAPLIILRDMMIMFILSVISTLYPILRINRYSPVEAIHHV
ncbi:MAG TPA: ABC transporter permease [Desulfobulbus sp.]|nr:ABC transporter permease [Desulfobulbus sp.]